MGMVSVACPYEGELVAGPLVAGSGVCDPGDSTPREALMGKWDHLARKSPSSLRCG